MLSDRGLDFCEKSVRLRKDLESDSSSGECNDSLEATEIGRRLELKSIGNQEVKNIENNGI